MYGRSKLLSLAALIEGSALLLAFLLAGFFAIELHLGVHRLQRDIVIALLGVIPPFALFVLMMSEQGANLSWASSLRHTVMYDIKFIFVNLKLIDLVLISLMAGVGEELLFRGVLQEKFGIFTASILFGIVHCISLPYVVAATVMGFYIGLFYQYSDSLSIPVIIHFTYDLAALVYLKYIIPVRE